MKLQHFARTLTLSSLRFPDQHTLAVTKALLCFSSASRLRRKQDGGGTVKTASAIQQRRPYEQRLHSNTTTNHRGVYTQPLGQAFLDSASIGAIRPCVLSQTSERARAVYCLEKHQHCRLATPLHTTSLRYTHTLSISTHVCCDRLNLRRLFACSVLASAPGPFKHERPRNFAVDSD